MSDLKEGEDANKSIDEQGEKADLKLKSGQAEEPVFVVVEEMPTFRGGDVNYFREWVQRNVNYPDIAVENGIQGKVFVSFVVDKEGNVSDVDILRGVDPSLDDEVIRVVHSSPTWLPGKQRDVPVNVKFSITVNFQLQ
jgi:protein TonB